MKQFALMLGFFLLASGAFAQSHAPEKVHFKNIAKERSKELHAKYPKVAQVKFKDAASVEAQHEKVEKAWHDLWEKVTEYTRSKGLDFDRNRKLFVHLHFSETGHLDYFGYHFKGAEDEKDKRFIELFMEYVKTHNFGLNEGVKFSQCGEIHILAHEGVKEGM